MSKANKEAIFLKYADVINMVNDANEDLAKMAIQKRLTAGRDFRRTLRGLRDAITDVIKVSHALEKDIRSEKEVNKDVSS